MTHRKTNYKLYGGASIGDMYEWVVNHLNFNELRNAWNNGTNAFNIALANQLARLVTTSVYVNNFVTIKNNNARDFINNNLNEFAKHIRHEIFTANQHNIIDNDLTQTAFREYITDEMDDQIRSIDAVTKIGNNDDKTREIAAIKTAIQNDYLNSAYNIINRAVRYTLTSIGAVAGVSAVATAGKALWRRFAGNKEPQEEPLASSLDARDVVTWISFEPWIVAQIYGQPAT